MTQNLNKYSGDVVEYCICHPRPICSLIPIVLCAMTRVTPPRTSPLGVGGWGGAQLTNLIDYPQIKNNFFYVIKLHILIKLHIFFNIGVPINNFLLSKYEPELGSITGTILFPIYIHHLRHAGTFA